MIMCYMKQTVYLKCIGSNPERFFKGTMGRCKATTTSSLSLTSNRVTTTNLDRQPS